MKSKIEIPSCEECSTRICSIFSELTPEELELISHNKGGNLYKRGQHIFFAGTRPSGLYCINSGKVKVFKIDQSGKEQIVRLAKSGDILGYRTLISGDLYTSFAAPLEDSMICFIPKSVFLNLIQSNPMLSMKVMQLLAQDLRAAEERIANIAQKSVRERLAEALLILREFYGMEEDNETLGVAITREDLANIVGTATETVIRFLS
ncbi:MAG: Crp/Fnr family transcriptional regulator, partial [Calditrichaeota bacterium]